MRFVARTDMAALCLAMPPVRGRGARSTGSVSGDMIWKILAVTSLVVLPLSLALWRKSHHEPEEFRYDVSAYRSLRISLREGTCGFRLLSMPRPNSLQCRFRTSLDRVTLPPQRSFLFRSVRR
ncbi:MAG: hypothetical protein ACE5EX_08950, partial [Phycisphaerae bacterium]